MKTPQVPAMAGMTPLGIKPAPRFECSTCNREYPTAAQQNKHTWRCHCGAWNSARPLVNPLRQDQAELARRKAAAPMLAPKPQQACDLGLFSDSAQQTDLVDMVRARK